MNEEMIDKRVMVTGASSGIGRATAELFMSAGATVSIDGGRALTCAR